MRSTDRKTEAPKALTIYGYNSNYMVRANPTPTFGASVFLSVDRTTLSHHLYKIEFLSSLHGEAFYEWNVNSNLWPCRATNSLLGMLFCRTIHSFMNIFMKNLQLIQIFNGCSIFWHNQYLCRLHNRFQRDSFPADPECSWPSWKQAYLYRGVYKREPGLLNGHWIWENVNLPLMPLCLDVKMMKSIASELR